MNHGGAAPQTREAANLKLLAGRDLAIDALIRALESHGEPCEHCGRTDSDKDPAVIRAAQIVLDRSGMHPTLQVQVQSDPNPYEDLTEDELIERLETLLKRCYESRDFNRQHRFGEHAPMLLDTGVVDAEDAYLVPEDEVPEDEIQKADVRMPFGSSTDEKCIAAQVLTDEQVTPDD